MNCPICASEAAIDFTVKEHRTLLICERCRHVWFQQVPTPEQLAAHYSSRYTSLHSQEDLQTSQVDYYRAHALELVDLVGESMAIADIGCSVPVFLREAAAQSSRRIGVDLSEEAHALGRRWGFEVMSPDDFISSVPDESLDVLRYSHVLEHLPDPLDTLKQHVPKLKRGGLLYFCQPNFPVFKARRAEVDLSNSVWPEHLHFFNPLSALELVRRAGLTTFRFLTHSEERKTMEELSAFVDFITAADRLESIKDITIDYGMFTGWPFYAGSGMGCFARRD